MSKPKIKIWDIETSFNLLVAFGLYNDNGISHKQLLGERYILCAAFRDYGSKKVRGYSIHEYDTWDKDPHDDWAVVKAIHDELSDCDAIVAHYGDRFDLPFFNARAAFHGLEPIANIIQIDTCKIARKHFKFNNNRLDYIAKFFGLEGKSSTNMQLWLDCWNGDVKAMKEMLDYNKQDVDVLYDVYEKLKPYAPAKINYSLFNNLEVCCPHCGSTDIHYRGHYYTRRGKFPKFQCQECGGWGSDASKEKDVPSKVK